eukprot:TRINITY_DN29848_c0_g1_i1.p1 TRINITY_DN29848_c0_g1~~TRINITY_DN29848_c0_g1_i1.p1  ORF type:complete len:2398 (+),score=562.80 TRINITY_DN29848_c0_g1_i1:189-7382(+)
MFRGLQGALEEILKRFLAPYLEDLNLPNLYTGIFTGHIVLKGLRLKPEVLGLFGLEGYRLVDERDVGCIRLLIPWGSISSGKLTLAIEGLNVHVEQVGADGKSDSDLRQSMREVKRKAIDVRHQQVKDLLSRQKAAQEAVENEEAGFFVKVTRKFLNNIRIDIRNVNLTFASKSLGLAGAVELPRAAVISCDENFRECPEDEVVQPSGAQLYKSVEVQNFGIRLAAASKRELPNAAYVVSPFTTIIRLGHEPEKQRLKLLIELGARKLNMLTLSRSQVRKLLGAPPILQAETERIQNILLASETREAILEYEDNAKAEFGQLLRRRQLLEEKLEVDGYPALAFWERERIQELEDALSVQILAAQHIAVEEFIQEQKKLAKKRRVPIFGRLMQFMCGQAEEVGTVVVQTDIRLVSDIKDAAEYEAVDLPQQVELRVKAGGLAVSLVDDMQANSKVPSKKLLRLLLHESSLSADVRTGTDFRGNQSVEFFVDFTIGALDASSGDRPVLRRGDTSSSETHATTLRSGAGHDSMILDGNNFAKLRIQNTLEADANLLSLAFEVAPMEIRVVPGMIAELTAFAEAPPPPPGVIAREGGPSPGALAQQSAAIEAALAPGGVRYVLAERADVARDYAEIVYERIPDKVSVYVKIATPRAYIPVQGWGEAVIALGDVYLSTPSPCQYDAVSLELELGETSLRTETVKGELFDVIRPVPIKLAVKHKETDDAIHADLLVTSGDLKFALSPEALKIVSTIPDVLLKEAGGGDADKPQVGGFRVGQAAHVLRSDGSWTDCVVAGFEADNSIIVDMHGGAKKIIPPKFVESMLRPVDLQSPAMSAVAQDFHRMAASEDLDESYDLVQKAKEAIIDQSSALGAAAKKLEQTSSKKLLVDVAADLGKFDVLLSDSVIPVLWLRLDLPSIKVHDSRLVSGLPSETQFLIEDVSLEGELLNTRTGRWEPLVEHFNACVQGVAQADADGMSATKIAVRGKRPLLLNLAPSMVTRLNDMGQHFGSSIQPGELADGAGKAADLMKYRVLNLCPVPLHVICVVPNKPALKMQIEPTGSRWVALDETIIRGGVTALALLGPGGHMSEQLLLEQTGTAVSIPGTEYVAEWLMPAPSHRMLLLSTPQRFHNRTDFDMHLRFHDFSGRVMQGSVSQAMVCDAALLGMHRPDCKIRSEYQPARERMVPGDFGVLVLPPNHFCSVAYVKDAKGLPCCRLSTKPSGFDVEFSAPAPLSCEKVGVQCMRRGYKPVPKPQPGKGGQGPRSSRSCLGFCGRNGNPPVSEPQGRESNKDPDIVHFACEPIVQKFLVPDPLELTTLCLKPTLALLNVVPIGTLGVAYALKQGAAEHWQEEALTHGTHLNIYSLSSDDIQEGLDLCARFEDCPRWSSTIHLQESAAGAQILDLRQEPKGAAAGLAVEEVTTVFGRTLRLSCPAWFRTRAAGFGQEGSRLRVRHGGYPLPQAGGITLLPANCTEVACDLLLETDTGKPATTSLTMPPNFSSFSWKTPLGSYVLCVQAEDVVPSDVCGARCQVWTLRPHLVLTNDSDVDIEIRMAECTDVFTLRAKQSREQHWVGKKNWFSEEAHEARLSFRRATRNTSTPWSSTVVCSDPTAGSTPYRIPSGGSAGQADTWTVQVAPLRGAMAVTFCQQSAFVAVNNATSQKAKMTVQPEGTDAIEIPAGKEVPIGWARPMESSRGRTIDIAVNGRRCVVGHDVRRSMRHVIKPKSSQEKELVLLITRVGDQTRLSLEESQYYLKWDSTGKACVQCEVELPSLGISLVQEDPTPRELLFLHLDDLHLDYRSDDADTEKIQFLVSEAQVACQLPGRMESKAGAKRSNVTNLLAMERPAVVLANAGSRSHTGNGSHKHEDNPFLLIDMRREATSSRDLLIKLANVSLDAIDISVDDEWLTPLQGWLAQALPDDAAGGVNVRQTLETAGKPIIKDYSPPPVTAIVQVDGLHISKVMLTLWASMKLKGLDFLPSYVRGALTVLSLSDRFELDGVGLVLPSKDIPPHRGSLDDFSAGIINEYTLSFLKHTASLLGKSSLMNLPRKPLQVGGNAVSLVSDGIGGALGKGVSLLDKLTFDKNYSANRSQARASKRIESGQEGAFEAGKTLLRGFGGLGDIVRKPIEGAQKKGLRGFIRGIGKGVAGAVVKPIVGIGDAAADITAGLSAASGSDSKAKRRRRERQRQRQPRLLFAELGEIRPWSPVEAEVLKQLGWKTLGGVQEVIPLSDHGEERHVLLLFLRKLIIARVSFTGEDDSPSTQNSAHRPGSHSPENSKVGSTASSIAGMMKKTSTKEEVDPTRLSEVLFKDVAKMQVQMSPQNCPSVLKLQKAQGLAIDLVLDGAPIGPQSRAALAETIGNALSHPTRKALYGKLRTALKVDEALAAHLEFGEELEISPA